MNIYIYIPYLDHEGLEKIEMVGGDNASHIRDAGHAILVSLSDVEQIIGSVTSPCAL